jgi:TldD protein
MNYLISKGHIFLLIKYILLLLNIHLISAQDPLIGIVSDELEREYARLKQENYPPYYLSYRIDEVYSTVIESTFGSLTQSDDYKGRILTATVRVGSYELDNTHELKKGYNLGNISHSHGAIFPVENDTQALQQVIWRITDRAYKNAVSSYSAIINSLKSDSIEDLCDFSKEPASKYYEPTDGNSGNEFDRAAWEEKIKKYSGPFLKEKSVLVAKALISYINERKYFISSEGSRIAQNNTYTRLQIFAKIKADDGSMLPLYKSYYAYKPSGLPDDKKIMEDVGQLIGKLKELKNASIAEPYTGPAILSPGAAGVFFHEIFGHRVEGHRLRKETDGHTFKSKIGERVLPKYMDVIFDPTLNNYKGEDLFGSYKYDDQGVKASRVMVVNKGILNSFIMSRTPVKGFASSNGHGRAQAGMYPVARQSNLIVESSSPFSDKELRKLLIKECKKQKKEYGYFFKEVIGGFTLTNIYAPNVFNIIPTEVYRIYVDGRPDELVRGVELIGTPLLMFSEIKATGDSPEVFTGFCGAESGNVPVTAISSSLFVRKIETQKKPEDEGQMPILPRPGFNKETGNY